jgi:hypothetical protein
MNPLDKINKFYCRLGTKFLLAVLCSEEYLLSSPVIIPDIFTHPPTENL